MLTECHGDAATMETRIDYGRAKRGVRNGCQGDYARGLTKIQALLFAAVLVNLRSFAYAATPLSAAVESPSGYTFLEAESNSPVLESILESGDDSRKGAYNFLTYAIGMIINPCKGRDPDCCLNIYGEPEYVRHSPVVPATWLWALAAHSDSIYTCQMPCIGNWTLVNDTKTIYEYSLDQIDSDVDYIWGLSLSESKLFRRTLDAYETWTFISGNFSAFTTSGAYAMYAINYDSPLEILACVKPCDGQWKTPTEVDGHPLEGEEWAALDLGDTVGTVTSYKYIGADETHVWVVLDDGRLFARRVLLPPKEPLLRWKDVWIYDGAYGQWLDLTPSNKKVAKVVTSIQLDTIWILTESGTAQGCVRPCDDADWSEAGAPGGNGIIQDIDADDRYVWAVSTTGQVYRRSASISSSVTNWVTIPSSSSEIDSVTAAWDTIPDGGFKQITSPALLTNTDSFTEYTVEEFGQDCALVTDEDSCTLKTTELCVWNVETYICEKQVSTKASRLPDLDITFEDGNCIIAEVTAADGTVSMEPGFSYVRDYQNQSWQIKRDPDCLDQGVRSSHSTTMPACWDHNTTVDASASCYDPDGNETDTCVAIAYATTVYIPKCGGAYADSDSCGTFLELHAPGEPDIINQIRVESNTSFVSGYTTTIMPLQFANNSDHVICLGDYELWWTQRTRKRKIVEAIKKFSVTYPPCDWNDASGEYETFASIDSL